MVISYNLYRDIHFYIILHEPIPSEDKGVFQVTSIKEKLSINNKLSVTYLVEMAAFTACRHGQMKSPAEMIFRFSPTMPTNKLIVLPCSIYH